MSKFCLIGKSLKHTLSPEIHKEFGFLYGVREIPDLESLKNFMSEKDFDGINVTIPYKTDVMAFLDVIDAPAREIGAVNTITNVGGKLFGYNADAGGMEYAISSAGIDIKNKNVLVLGSGGTSKTATFVLKRGGAKSVETVSRSGDINYQNCYERVDTEIIIDTTPVGMFPNAYERALDISKFRSLLGVFDAVYNPLETLIVAQGRHLGIAASNGLSMLVEQARLAHNLFVKDIGIGEIVKEDKTACVVKTIRKRMQNITFIGMAGSGKTTIARAVAALLGREFVDTDIEIEKQTGKSVPELFEELGEQGFREIESDVILKVCGVLGRVIATGGGAVLNEKNRFYISCNSSVIWLKRKLNKLETANRPLSKSAKEVERLYLERKDIYNDLADMIIENNADAWDTAREIADIMAENTAKRGKQYRDSRYNY